MDSPIDKQALTRHFGNIKAGDKEAVRLLLPQVYTDLRAVAGRLVQGTGPHTLQPTALVHEVYMRLVDAENQGYSNRKHFFRVAAIAMRQLLSDHARARSASKRGGAWVRVELDPELPAEEIGGLDLIALNEALEELSTLDERVARTVELRLLTGLSIKEAGEALDVSERTARNDWNMGRAWLDRRFNEEAD